MTGAVRQMTFFVAALTGALDEDDFLDFFAVRRAFDDAAIGGLGEHFQTHLIDHVRAICRRRIRAAGWHRTA